MVIELRVKATDLVSELSCIASLPKFAVSADTAAFVLCQLRKDELVFLYRGGGGLMYQGSIPAVHSEERIEEFMLNYSKTLELVKKFRTGEVSLRVGESGVKVSERGMSGSFQSISHLDYAYTMAESTEIRSEEKSFGASISTSALASAIGYALAVPRDRENATFELKSIAFTFNVAGSSVEVVASNGVACCVTSVSCEVNEKCTSFRFLMTPESAKSVRSFLMGKGDSALFFANESKLMFVSGGRKIQTPSLSGRYPDIGKLMREMKAEDRFTVDAEDFARAIDASVIVNDPEAEGVRLHSPDDTVVSVSTGQKTSGDVDTMLDSSMLIGEVDTKVDSRQLKWLLASVRKPSTVTWSQERGSSGKIVITAEGTTAKWLLVPLT